MSELKEYNKDLLESYILTTASYDYSIYEKRILTKITDLLQFSFSDFKKENFRVANQITKDLFGDYKIKINVADIDKNNNYNRVKNACLSLAKKGFEYEDDKIWTYINFLTEPKITKKNGEFSFRVSEEFASIFINFSKGYRKFEYKVAMNLKNPNSVKLYQLFSNKESPITYSIQKIRKILGVEEKYLKFYDFKRHILEPCKKELDKNAPYSFTYETKLVKRQVVSITFKPFYQEKFRDETLIKKEQQNKLSIHWTFSKEVINYLKSKFNLTTNGIKNNKELLEKAMEYSEFGDWIENITKLISDLTVKNRLHNLKEINKPAMFISQIKKYVAEYKDVNPKGAKEVKNAIKSIKFEK